MGYSPWGRKELDTTERLHLSNHLILQSQHLTSTMQIGKFLVLNSIVFLVIYFMHSTNSVWGFPGGTSAMCQSQYPQTSQYSLSSLVSIYLCKVLF